MNRWKDTPDKGLLIAMGVIVIILGILLTVIITDKNKKWNEAPCDYFSNRPLSEVPYRCLNTGH